MFEPGSKPCGCGPHLRHCMRRNGSAMLRRWPESCWVCTNSFAMEDIACTMDVRLREQWDSLRSSYWFVQAVLAAGAVIGWIAIDTMDRLLRATATLQAGFVLGHQRTLVQDIDFGINKLVEVALRARAPAINDPFTA